MIVTQPQSILTFDGENDYVELPITSIPEGNEITISFWAKGGNRQPRNNSVFYAGAPSQLDRRIINIHLPWEGSICWDCGSNGSVNNRISKKGEAADIKGNWVHWAFTLNAGTGRMKMYRNGGELWEEGNNKTHPIPKVGNVKLGSGYAFYNGSLCDVRVWRRALEPNEIHDTMLTRLTGQEKDLVSYWPLDEGTGDRIIDKTGHGNDGKIHGAVWDTTTEFELAAPKVVIAPTIGIISTMKFPRLSPPVKRPHFVEPALAVDVEHGRIEDLVGIRMDLLHGANYNDPAAFVPFRY